MKKWFGSFLMGSLLFFGTSLNAEFKAVDRKEIECLRKEIKYLQDQNFKRAQAAMKNVDHYGFNLLNFIESSSHAQLSLLQSIEEIQTKVHWIRTLSVGTFALVLVLVVYTIK